MMTSDISSLFIVQNSGLKKYSCKICDYNCSDKRDLNKHLNTIKHLKVTKIVTENTNTIYEKKYDCLCGKKYSHRQGLSTHKKTCKMIHSIPIYATNEQKQQLFTDEMFMELIKQNQEFKELMLEQNKKQEELNRKNEELTNKLFELTKESKNITNYLNNTNTLTNNSNNNNNTFNLQVFLNETCKNAMNLTDFVNSLNVTIADLEETGRLGFSDGITKIIVKGLKDLDVTERPIHCTDVKRETIYVKEEDIWQKDDNHDKLTKAIKQVSYKNTKNIMEWQRLNPEYNDSNSKQSSRFNKLLLNVMSGGTIEEQQGNLIKIVKNITREVVLNKGAIVEV